MVRYAGIKQGRICAISDKPFTSSDLEVLEIPEELNSISAADLILYGRIKDKSIRFKLNKMKSQQLRVAFVTNHNMECGLATYAGFLFPEIAKHVGDFKLFIEKNDKPVLPIHQFGNDMLPEEKVVQCWKRGESLNELIVEIKHYDPDIILINHEFGLFPNARYFISMMGQLSDYRTIVIMHSVFPNHKDKVIVEAAMKEIVVHLDGAKNNLKNEKKISAEVHVIPHGCYEVNGDKLWNFYKSDHTFIQIGFLFSYKGWEDSLRVVASLKDKYPDIFFTGIMSESPFAKVEHELYFQDLMRLVKELKIEDHVGLIRGYQSEEVLDSYMRTNKVALFPYVSSVHHEVFGASGSARLAMSKNLPVITSRINHFSDLPTIKGSTVADYTEHLDALFSDSSKVAAQLDMQNRFINENTWEKTALKYIDVFESPPKS